MKYIQEVEANGLVWVNVSRQHEKELSELGKRFGFERADIAEALPPFQRPKIVKRGHYYLIILHFPIFNRETKRLGFTAVDIFLEAWSRLCDAIFPSLLHINADINSVDKELFGQLRNEGHMAKEIL